MICNPWDVDHPSPSPTHTLNEKRTRHSRRVEELMYRGPSLIINKPLLEDHHCPLGIVLL